MAAAGAAERSPFALIDTLEDAWSRRDTAAYFAAWRFASAETEASERLFAAELLGAEETQLRVERPGPLLETVKRLRVPARFFTVTEPRGSAQQSLLTFERSADGWSVVNREPSAEVEGLLHLSLDPSGFVADGLTIKLPDLDIRLEEGTLFTAPPAVGPTVLVFSGTGVVEFHPTPPTEQEQLRQYSGKPRLTAKVRSFFMRLHPANLYGLIPQERLAPDPRSSQRYASAKSVYDKHVSQLFILDTPLPRSPWWLTPALGDVALVFEGRKGPLTYAIDSSNPEDVSLFDRPKRRQVCLYARDGKPVSYNEDDLRVADALHHDLDVRFDPSRGILAARDRLRIKLTAPTSSLRLRLDDALTVESVRSPDYGGLLFFRVRDQDNVMVSLGVLGSRAGEITLDVRYSGRILPGLIEDDVIQAGPGRVQVVEEMPLEDVQIFTNRIAWYPQVSIDDFATATMRFDLPAGYTAVSGGARAAARVESERSIVEYSLSRPGKYFSVAFGRFVPLPATRRGSVELSAFVVPRLKSAAPRRLEQATEIVAFYESLFGPCPYDGITLALVEGRVPGGHSPPGMVLLAERPVVVRRPLRDDPANFIEVPGFFLAHEIAHQWWGHGVAGENYHERWISEGFAQYAAAVWARHALGERAFRDVMEHMARWALKENAHGPVSLGYRLGHVLGDPQIFRAIVYNKAACVLHMLRGVAGDEAFFGALTGLQQQHRFQKIGTDDVRQALEATSGKQLGPYFDAWIASTTVPVLQVQYRAEAAETGSRTVVAVEATGVPGPLALAWTVIGPKGEETRNVTLQGPGGTWTFDAPSKGQRVELRPDSVPFARVLKR
jgi:hypothetical protein